MRRRLTILGALCVVVLATASPAAAVPEPDDNVCTPTGYVRDGINLTADYINPVELPEDVDASPCHIGVYYEGGSYTVANSFIHGASYYGILAVGPTTTVTISDSSAYDIGDDPQFSGAQHGVAIAYVDGAQGSLTRVQVHDYQKNGFVADGAGTRVDIDDSRFRGEGPVDWIAQNGVQFSRGAVGSVMRSTMEDHEYTVCSPREAAQTGCTQWVSAGLLIFDSPPSEITRRWNLYRDNDFNVLNFQTPGA